MMNFCGLLGSLLAFLACRAVADFTNSFDSITGGLGISLTWDAVAPQYYPLRITAQLIDKGADNKANVYKSNITTSVDGNSYQWIGAPYPLRWIRSGLYQLELRPSVWTSGDPPVLAKSPFFAVQDQVTVLNPSSSPPKPTLVDVKSETPSGVNKSLAIGLGVAIGLPSVVALVLVGWCFRKRRRAAAMEKRRLKRSEFIIH
ncbi:hypothetical protein B0H63DRAFT_486465 [Podospora didyma]|uniref:Uncharacterized protein n=1 Tax=Podospora didyma TaxID=330526 RepID=A0AAE0N482_9PEZI|nr:hypothetical protein B0H63DRAFT_486465 [Podospora didyma]